MYHFIGNFGEEAPCYWLLREEEQFYCVNLGRVW